MKIFVSLPLNQKERKQTSVTLVSYFRYEEEKNDSITNAPLIKFKLQKEGKMMDHLTFDFKTQPAIRLTQRDNNSVFIPEMSLQREDDHNFFYHILLFQEYFCQVTSEEK